MVCLALELVGPWVVLGFSVGMEAFDELLLINVPDHVTEHALFTWLITHLSRDITCTDHVALMH